MQETFATVFDNGNCGKNKQIISSANHNAWKKYLLFINEKYQTESIIQYVSSLRNKFSFLQHELSVEQVRNFNWNLDEFILTNEEREGIISDLKLESDVKTMGELSDLIEGQCEICDKWFCNIHFDNEQFKCNIHQKMINI